jgi:Dolichyl-phosphate-mannose-protein mannosyltransferase
VFRARSGHEAVQEQLRRHWHHPGVIAGTAAPSAPERALRADESPSRARKMAAAAGGHVRRHGIAFSILFGLIVALLLRAPWSDAALGRDEGGVALIARAWHGTGPFLYGSYFLDRPPLLPALYKLAGPDQSGIRVLGAVAAVLLVITSTFLAVRIAGRAAAPWAAGIAAVLASSWELRSVFTPAELLAAVPSSASVLLLLVALQRESRRLRLFAAAGALAATALLVKQSFGDALVAGLVALLAGKALGLSWRETARRAGAYAAGVGAVALTLIVWVLATAATAHDVWYAMFGFRLDSVSVLAKHGLEARLSSLESPLLASGLALALVFAFVALVRLRERPLVSITVGAWIAAAAAGILLGGSYWPHYLIALVPAAAAGAATLFRRYPVVGVIGTLAIAVQPVVHATDVAIHDSADSYQRGAVILGDYIHARSLPGDTVYVMYSKPNALYYSGLRVPYPYNWSLMPRAVPGARDLLRRVLASAQRPTWIVRTHGPNEFGLDASGATRRLLNKHYRRVATVCGIPLLLARGTHPLPAPGGPLACKDPGAG